MLDPGIYPNLDRADLPPGLSYSGAKDILNCPALYRWKRANPSAPSEAMETGTVTHALILDTPQCWRTIDGGRGVTERRKAARAEGLIPITTDALATAARMAVAVRDLPEAADLLDRCSSENREVAAIAQDPETGVWVRCYFDALHDGGRYGVDVKTGREGTLGDFARTAANLGYDLQAATYAAVMEWLGQPIDALLFCIVESSEPHFVGVRELDADFLARGRARLRRALDTYAACVETDTWPGPATYQTISAPPWALRAEGIPA
ncbi:MAG: PD-(D/E)XK nuclease-like domain-containing protein [Nocardioides sp.]|uniref:PD-(D/E)XK nuclease-like domain-containing protein n=1 Tax=Nocardioides sp. TaxID=35761 RepID=UPI0039E3A8F5